MAAKDYKVKKRRFRREWQIFDKHTGAIVARSKKSHWHARVAAHIRDDWSQKYPKKKTAKARAKRKKRSKGGKSR